MTARDAQVLAVDIGGSKLAAAWVGSDGVPRGHTVVATPPAPPDRPDVAWDALAALLDRMVLIRQGTLLGVAAGTAGPLDRRHGNVSPINIPAWRDFPLLQRLRERFPRKAVLVAGDAICAAIGEHWRGAGQGHRHMLGVVVSTGVGGGLVLDGRVHFGRSGNAGHVGHVIVDLDGEPCPCGSVGCVETVASAPSLVAWARGQGWDPGTRRTCRDLADDARRGVPVALAAFDRAGRALAAGLVSATATCDLDLAVLGGGVAGAGAVLLDPVRAWLTRLAGLAFTTRLEVSAAALGPTAGLVGAAALLHRPERYGSGMPAA